MKKSLFMLALGLTIATSMVAGTMAVYTHTDTITPNNSENGMLDGIAKKFFVGAKTTKTLDDFKLAPGESVDWEFQITNVDNNGVKSEVDTDMIVDVNVGTIHEWADLAIVLKQGNTEIKTLKPTDGKVAFTVEDAMKASTDSTKNYTLTFKWLDGAEGTKSDLEDTALVMNETSITEDAKLPHVQNVSVTVTGTQSK